MTISYVDLKQWCNADAGTALIPAISWDGLPVAAKKLDGFPEGEQVFARVPFKVAAAQAGKGPSFVLLAAEDRQERSIAVEAAVKTIYLLHTTDRGDLGRQPAVYTLHYADGSSAERVITVGEDVADWLFPREFANCLIGWTGYHRDNEYQKCVYVAEIINPCPKKKVRAITLKRQQRDGQYALLGMTLSTSAPFFKQAKKGSRVGLGDYLHLDSDILTLKGGALELRASLYSRAGKPINDARLTALVGGKQYDFPKCDGDCALSVPRQKGWRQYGNTVTIVARRDGKTIARRDAVLYCEGRPRLLTPPHGRRPPQFILIGFDDCKVLPGVESMLEIIENVRARGARAVFTMYTSPCEPRSPDIEKVKLIYKRMYDLGCEFANHTLNHNPGGVNWFALSEKEQEREITGCRQWLRDAIPGLWHVYAQKSGGGGRAGFRDPKLSRDLLRRQEFEYDANHDYAKYGTSLPHPDVQFWPYKLGDEWSVDLGMIDGNAPPMHRPITKGFLTDYSGKFDYEVAEGVAMLRANFDYRYRSRERPPMSINAFHEWGLGPYWLSHRNEKAILEGFLIDVLVRNRRKYPDTYVITFHQLIEYMKRDDIAAIIAEGNGQGKKE